MEKIQPNPNMATTPAKLISLFLDSTVSRIKNIIIAANIAEQNTVCVTQQKRLENHDPVTGVAV